MDKAGFQTSGTADLQRSTGLTVGSAVTEQLSAWLDLTCRALTGVRASIIVVAGKDEGSFELTSSWPDQATALHLVPFSERCLSAREIVAHDGDGVLVVATPLLERGKASGALVLEVTQDRGSLLDVRTAVVVAARYLNHILLGKAGDADESQGAFLQGQKELLQLVCRPDIFTKSALETVNWVAKHFGCASAGLGMARKGGVHLQALSHSAWFDRKSQAVTAIENAMGEALDQRRTVVLPPVPEVGAAISNAHREVAKGASVCSVVLAGGDGLGAGVLYLERSASSPFLMAEVKALEEMGQLIGPVLESKDSAYRWIGGRTRIAWRGFFDRLRDPRRPALRVALVLAAVALAARRAGSVSRIEEPALPVCQPGPRSQAAAGAGGQCGGPGWSGHVRGAGPVSKFIDVPGRCMGAEGRRGARRRYGVRAACAGPVDGCGSQGPAPA